MKSITGRIAPKQTRHFIPEPGITTFFDQHSLLWQLSLPGVKAAAALRRLLLQAAEYFGEEAFPYQRTAESLFKKQTLIFNPGKHLELGTSPNARRWGQAVWLDLHLRSRLPSIICTPACTNDTLYAQYLLFANLIGLNSDQLPATFGAFNGWAEASLFGWESENYRKLALNCIQEVLPLCWPVNLALILNLLPREFWGVYGGSLGSDSARLASRAGKILTDLSFSK